MATVHSTQACLPKLCCSIAAVGLFIASILATGAYPHSNLDHSNLNQTTNTAKGNNLDSPGNFTLAAERLASIHASNKAFHEQLDKALDKIDKSMRRIPELADRISRSPRTVRTMQALEAATAKVNQNQPKPEYQISEYATGNRRWKRNPRARRAGSPGASTTTKEETTTEWFLRNLATSPFPIQTVRKLGQALHILTRTAPQNGSEYATGIKRSRREPSVYPFQITDLLEYEVRNKHSQNKILGEKVAKILHQNTDLSDEIAADYQTPSEKLKKDPIMALVTKTLSTYMLVKHSKNAKEKSQEENLSPWGEPFFKKKE
jgi:hypothetical protein